MCTRFNAVGAISAWIGNDDVAAFNIGYKVRARAYGCVDVGVGAPYERSLAAHYCPVLMLGRGLFVCHVTPGISSSHAPHARLAGWLVQIIYLCHQFGMSLGIATSIRVSTMLGSGDAVGAKRSRCVRGCARIALEIGA